MKKSKRTSFPTSAQDYPHLEGVGEVRKRSLWLAGGSVAGAAFIGATLADIKGAIIGGLVGFLVAMLGASSRIFGDDDLDPTRRVRGSRSDESEARPRVVFFLLMLLISAGMYIYWTRVPIPQIGASTLAHQNVMEIRYVNSHELNLRETPSEYSSVIFILPRGTRLEVLNEAQQEFDGDLWVKVRVQTREGLQDGWVNARYLR